MSVVRRFLVAPSLVRLIRKERGGSRITEGYFAPQAGRTSYVRVDGQQCHLILVSTAADGSSAEERTDVPRAHGDALLDVCTGKAAYDRTTIALGGGREASIDRYIAPGALDIITLTFPGQGEAAAFSAPAWFGPDVSADAAYERHAVALHGAPQPGEIALSNAALEAVLDLVEPRFGFGRFGAAARPSDDDGGMTALRRIASSPASVAAAAIAAPQEAPASQDALALQDASTPQDASASQDAPAQHDAPAAVTEPEPEPASSPEHARQAYAEREEPPQGDTRIDDVIESLSLALGASVHAPQPAPHETPRLEPARDEDAAAAFERWTVRPRRNQQQT